MLPVRRLIIFSFLMFWFLGGVCSYAQIVNKVVAVVNEEVITQKDIDQLLSVLYAQYVHVYKDDELLDKMEEVKRGILGRVIEDKLILSRAKELNVRVTEGEINEKLEQVKSGFESEDEFYMTLETQGITIEDLKNRYKDQIMMKKIVDFEIQSKVNVLPSEMRKYYEGHREDFKLDERYKVRHILIRAEDEVSLELVELEMRDIYNRLAAGADFSELAKRYSEGPNKDTGGDVGYIRRGDMLEELDEVIFKLRLGEYSNPIKTGLGYHILKVEDIVNAGYVSLEDVQPDIKRMLFQEKIKKKLEEWLALLKKDAYISIKE